MQKFLFALLLITSINSSAAPSCSSFFKASSQYYLRETPNSIVPREGGVYASYVVVTSSGRQIGLFEAKINGTKMTNSYYEIFDPAHRSKGILKMFVAEILERFPEIKEIHEELSRDNFTALGIQHAQKSSLEDIARAVKGTPSYKVYLPYGFARIKIASVDKDVVDVILYRQDH